MNFMTIFLPYMAKIYDNLENNFKKWMNIFYIINRAKIIPIKTWQNKLSNLIYNNFYWYILNNNAIESLIIDIGMVYAIL